jgi:phage-related protein
VAESLVFRLVGQDGLSPILITASGNADDLERRIRAAADGSNASLTRFTQDAQGNLRDAEGNLLSAADAARILGQGTQDGAGQAQGAVRRLTTDANGRLRDLNGRFVSSATLTRALAGDLNALGDTARRAGDNTSDGATRGSNALRRLADSGRDNEDGVTLLSRLGGAARGAAPALAGLAGSAGLAASAIGTAVPLVAGLVATLVDISPAAGVGATALVALGSATGAVKLGTSGLGDAFKAAFADVPAGASAAETATRRVEAAERSLEDAQRRVADAQRGVADARVQAADRVRDAQQRVLDAERDLADAQDDARQAQEDLTEARRDAARELEDMQTRLAGARLDEREAVQRLKEAEEELRAAQRKPGTDPDELARLQLAYERAQLALQTQRTETQRLEQDTAAANAAGVEGSERVADAKERVADAAQAVADRERALAEAQAGVDAARLEGQRQIEDAQRRVADAQRSVADAQRALAEATETSAGQVSKLDQAMGKLSPNARAFVNEVIALKGSWDSLQLAVQDRLFEGLAGRLRTTADSVLPVLRTGLTDSAGALNSMAVGAMDAAAELAEDGTLGRAMGSATVGLQNLSGLPGVLIQGLGQVAAAAGPSFERLTAAGGDALDRLSERMTSAFESGRMQESIEHAIDLIGQMADVAGNVFEIIGNIFSAAQTSGGGMLGVLQDITAELAEITASDEVQGALKALFDVMATAGETIAPLLGQALRALAPVLEKLGPPAEKLITALGDALSPVIDALGPVLEAAAEAVGSLVEAAAPLLPVIGELAAALLPILIPFLNALNEIFIAAAPVIEQVADTLSQMLAPILAELPLLMEPFARLLSQGLIAAMPSLLDLLVQLTPSLISLSESFAEILVALTPLITAFADLQAKGLATLLPLLAPVIDLAAQLAAVLADDLAEQVTTIVMPALEGLTAILQGDFSKGMGLVKDAGVAAVRHYVEQMAMLPVKAAQAAASLGGKLGGLARDAGGRMVREVRDKISDAVGWLRGMGGRSGTALANLGSSIGGKARDAGGRMVREIRGKLTDAVNWIGGLPGRAREKLGDLGSVLYNSGRALIRGFIDGIKSKASDLKDSVGDLLGKARDLFPSSPAKEGPFSGRGWTLYSGQSTVQAWADGMVSRRDSVVAAAESVAGAAADRLTASTRLEARPAPVGAGLGAMQQVVINNTINVDGAIDPVATARQIQRVLAHLNRTTGGTLGFA